MVQGNAHILGKARICGKQKIHSDSKITQANLIDRIKYAFYS